MFTKSASGEQGLGPSYPHPAVKASCHLTSPDPPNLSRDFYNVPQGHHAASNLHIAPARRTVTPVARSSAWAHPLRSLHYPASWHGLCAENRSPFAPIDMHGRTNESPDQEQITPTPLRIVWQREVVKPAPWDRGDLEGRIREALGASIPDRVILWTAPPRLVVVR